MGGGAAFQPKLRCTKESADSTGRAGHASLPATFGGPPVWRTSAATAFVAALSLTATAPSITTIAASALSVATARSVAPAVSVSTALSIITALSTNASANVATATALSAATSAATAAASAPAAASKSTGFTDRAASAAATITGDTCCQSSTSFRKHGRCHDRSGSIGVDGGDLLLPPVVEV